MATDVLPTWEAEEQDAVLKLANKRYKSGRRNRAIILLMLRCGLRVSEVVGHEKREGGGLRVGDVDMTTGRIQIKDAKDTRKRKGKHSRAGRTVFADEQALRAIQAWWDDRAKIDNTTDYLFTTSTGKPVSPANVRQIIRRYADRANVPAEKAHPHALRHTYATKFLRDGGDFVSFSESSDIPVYR